MISSWCSDARAGKKRGQEMGVWELKGSEADQVSGAWWYASSPDWVACCGGADTDAEIIRNHSNAWA